MMMEDERERYQRAQRKRLRNDLERMEAGEAPEMPEAGSSVYSRPGAPGDRVSGTGPVLPHLRELRPEDYPPEDRFSDRIPPPEHPVPPEVKRKRRGGGILLKLFTALILLLFAAGILLFAAVYYFSSKAEYEPYPAIQEEASWNLPAAGKENVLNILLIGTDARTKDEDSRSDALILCSICPEKKQIVLISILRDSYTEIPGYGRNRINHAYQMGGAKLLAETIEMNFHIRIDHYVKVDFFSFVDIIDSLGGVDVEITEEEVRYLNAYLCDVNLLTGRPAEEDFLSAGGMYRLTGRQALAYSRIRYIGTDFGRTGRQRTVLQAAVRAAKRSPFRGIAALRTIMPAIVTDMTEMDLTLQAMRIPLLLGYQITEDRIPYDGTWWNDTMPNGQEVLNMDFGRTSQILRERLYQKP